MPPRNDEPGGVRGRDELAWNDGSVFRGDDYRPYGAYEPRRLAGCPKTGVVKRRSPGFPKRYGDCERKRSVGMVICVSKQGGHQNSG